MAACTTTPGGIGLPRARTRCDVGQLAATTATEIETGADDETEMGVFGFLAQPQRRENLAVALGEYLRFGMEAGSFDAT